MNTATRFVCPACGFAIFNRRIANCESCAAALPADLLFSPDEVSAMEAEHARNEKLREELEKFEKRERERLKRWIDDA
jgi:hypothetical protein